MHCPTFDPARLALQSPKSKEESRPVTFPTRLRLTFAALLSSQIHCVSRHNYSHRVKVNFPLLALKQRHLKPTPRRPSHNFKIRRLLMPFFHHSMLYILILYDLCLICASGHGLLCLLDAFAPIAS